ncbi:hypothetical protein L7F22_054737 [Adiantum nelumboides]|nr:hypothetical protein [Adiantum nelumboides]
MTQWPDAGGLTCFPHGGGESTVDYLIGSISDIPWIDTFSTGRRPLGADHTFLTFSLHTSLQSSPPTPPHTYTTIHFTHELSHVYSHHLHDRLLQLDPHASLDTFIDYITDIMHASALQSFPHSTHTDSPRTGTMPQNRWYDDECRDLRKKVRALEASGEITHREAQRRMHSLTRRKKRAWEEIQYWDLYHLLMSRDSKEAWRRIRESRQPTPNQDPQQWHHYAESLYHIPDQPPIRRIGDGCGCRHGLGWKRRAMGCRQVQARKGKDVGTGPSCGGQPSGAGCEKQPGEAGKGRMQGMDSGLWAT